ncbi:unnamed protein product [Discosporangium mesarthrocarpum]
MGIPSLHNELEHIENQIFDLEVNYLEETRTCGNVTLGWDDFLDAR